MVAVRNCTCYFVCKLCQIYTYLEEEEEEEEESAMI